MFVSDVVVNFCRIEQVIDWRLYGNVSAELWGRSQCQRNSLAAQFIAGKPEQFVLLEGTAQSEATFLAVERCAWATVDGGRIRTARIPKNAYIVKRIGSSQVSSAEIHMTIAVDAIGSGFRYNVQDQTGSLAVFGIVVVGENLKFLHFVDGCARTVASGNQLISDVCAIYVIKIAAIVDGARSDKIVLGQTAGIRLYAGSSERELRIVVHGSAYRSERGHSLQVKGRDVGRNVGSCGFNERRGGCHFHAFRGSRQS